MSTRNACSQLVIVGWTTPHVMDVYRKKESVRWYSSCGRRAIFKFFLSDPERAAAVLRESDVTAVDRKILELLQTVSNGKFISQKSQ